MTRRWPETQVWADQVRIATVTAAHLAELARVSTEIADLAQARTQLVARATAPTVGALARVRDTRWSAMSVLLR
jgi:hypothetical protein